jgi:3-isopropylmalate dehydrogenase
VDLQHPTGRVIGILPGEGVGPEMIGAAVRVLRAVEDVVPGFRCEVREGGLIGDAAIARDGTPLTPPVAQFCRDVFAAGGAILAGAGGDRFVYDCRREFGLYCKLNPLKPSRVALQASRMRPEVTAAVDILVVRENLGGVYQGEWELTGATGPHRSASQRFEYHESQVRDIVERAAQLAQTRRGGLTMVVKPNGVPTISQLWLDVARETALQAGVRLRELEIDYAAFQLLQDPRQFDVVVTPNLFGDILSDIGGVLLGSRGLCFGASYSKSGAAIYQTNHGAARDLAGTDRANPVGQIHSLAMLLRESFGRAQEARLIEAAVEHVWEAGMRTDDLAEPGARIVGTTEMTDCIVKAVVELAGGVS